MIYTVTLNPSLDYILSVPDFRLGKVNRTESEMILPGGKGINVSIVLKNLGIDSVMLGFIAGFTGVEIEQRARDFGCSTDFITLNSGASRINVKLAGNIGTDINARGPHIVKKDLKELYEKLQKLEDGDIVVLAGAIPPSLPVYIYEEIMEKMNGKNVRFVVDAANQLLLSSLNFHPFLVKPNRNELEEIFSVKLLLREDVVRYAKKLQELGAKNVVVSLDSGGAILYTEEGNVFSADAPSGQVINAVGAGDSMLAGFLYGYEKTGSMEEGLYYAVAAGSASAFSENLARKEDIEILKRRMRV